MLTDFRPRDVVLAGAGATIGVAQGGIAAARPSLQSSPD